MVSSSIRWVDVSKGEKGGGKRKANIKGERGGVGGGLLQLSSSILLDWS